VTAPAPRLEATARALVTGSVLGVLLAAGNVYTGLKINLIDGGSITAALVGFALFATFKRLERVPYGALENNITQTTASSAAIASYVTGVAGPIPALYLLGHRYPSWAVVLMGIAVGLCGIFAATMLRQKLIVVDKLPFPTGTATGEIIETIYAGRASALRRARLLLIAALVAMAITWLRDARPQLIPQMTAFPGALAGAAMGTLTLGISWSPVMVSTGIMIGLRNSASMLLGAGISWAVLLPRLARAGVIADASYSAGVTWIVWPAVGMLIASSFIPLILDWRALAQSVRDLAGLFRRRSADTPAVGATLRPRLFAPLLFAAVVTIFVVGWRVFGMSPPTVAAALVLALVLANVSGRTAGETDLAPSGAVGMLTQFCFAGGGSRVTLATGLVSMGTTSQTAQTLWALKAGHRLGASPRAQVTAQILGSIIGAIVSVPIYEVVVKSYGLGNQNMPASGVLSWKATAEAVSGGLTVIPRGALLAGILGMLAGSALTLASRGRGRWARFVPSSAAIGVAMLNPASLSVAAFAGALAMALYRRRRPDTDDTTIMALAAGGIAGESIMGVTIAILLALGAI
jgi:putative OPT family oligopeptide transporter